MRNFAIGGTSRPEGRVVGVGGVYILGLSHKRGGGGGNFLKYPLSGRGKFLICLNCLKITDSPLGINNEQSPSARLLTEPSILTVLLRQR